MALTDADLDGFTADVETVPSKTSGVVVSQIPASLVSLLEKQVPTVLDQKGKEIIIRLPVRAQKPEKPEEPAADAKAAEKEAYKTALAEYKEAQTVYAAAEKVAAETVKQLCLYATAWGKGQEPKLYIHKVMNRKDMPAYHARLSVQSWDKVPPENRPGRR
jgi:hypothetical protein